MDRKIYLDHFAMTTYSDYSWERMLIAKDCQFNKTKQNKSAKYFPTYFLQLKEISCSEEENSWGSVSHMRESNKRLSHDCRRLSRSQPRQIHLHLSGLGYVCNSESQTKNKNVTFVFRIPQTYSHTTTMLTINVYQCQSRKCRTTRFPIEVNPWTTWWSKVVSH